MAEYTILKANDMVTAKALLSRLERLFHEDNKLSQFQFAIRSSGDYQDRLMKYEVLVRADGVEDAAELVNSFIIAMVMII